MCGGEHGEIIAAPGPFDPGVLVIDVKGKE
jgi:hypothetical protein